MIEMFGSCIASMDTYFWQAVLMTLLAGLATGIGGLITVRRKHIGSTYLALALGFSAGVMIYVSFVELFAEALDTLREARGDRLGSWLTVISFFAGIALIALIDKFVPDAENPHELRYLESVSGEEQTVDKTSNPATGGLPLTQASIDAAPTGEATRISSASRAEAGLDAQTRQAILRMGLFSALAIAIHKFPEGFATFMSALQDPRLGLSITLAIAIHNIPEGIGVAVPVYYATHNRKKALGYAFLSGMAEPVGAIVGYLLLRPFITEETLGYVFAGVAGIMVYISLDELLPSAEKYGKHHVAIWGMIAGMAVMALSLLLFA